MKRGREGGKEGRKEEKLKCDLLLLRERWMIE